MSDELTRRDLPGEGEETPSPAGEPTAADFEGENARYVPASPVKRALAWIGVVYMVILVGLNTYFCFTAKTLHGLAPLLAVPGLVGLGITALISHRTAGRPGKTAAWLVAGACWALAAALLLPGIAGLMANFT